MKNIRSPHWLIGLTASSLAPLACGTSAGGDEKLFSVARGIGSRQDERSEAEKRPGAAHLQRVAPLRRKRERENRSRLLVFASLERALPSPQSSW